MNRNTGRAKCRASAATIVSRQLTTVRNIAAAIHLSEKTTSQSLDFFYDMFDSLIILKILCRVSTPLIRSEHGHPITSSTQYRKLFYFKHLNRTHQFSQAECCECIIFFMTEQSHISGDNQASRIRQRFGHPSSISCSFSIVEIFSPKTELRIKKTACSSPASVKAG